MAFEWLKGKVTEYLISGLRQAGTAREMALGVLGKISSFGAGAAPVLISLLNDEDTSVANKAERILSSMGTPALPHLVRALKEESIPPQKIIFVIGTFGAAAAGYASLLVKKTRDPRNEVAEESIRALGKIRVRSQEVFEVLSAGMKSEYWALGYCAANSMGAIASRRNLPQLLEMLRDERPCVRKNAAWALGGMGKRSEEALPELLERVKDSEYEVRDAAYNAIYSIARKAYPWIYRDLKTDFMQRIKEEIAHRRQKKHALMAAGDRFPRCRALEKIAELKMRRREGPPANSPRTLQRKEAGRSTA